MSRLAVFCSAVIACSTPSAPPAPAPPPLAECGAVADKLAAFELPAGATPQARASLVADHESRCRSAHVPAAEGACIATAPDRWSAERCAPSLFPEAVSDGSADCGALVDRTASLMPAGIGSDNRDRAIDIMRASCAQDGWPAALKHCVIGAATFGAVSDCLATMPKALQARQTARYMDAIQKPTP